MLPDYTHLRVTDGGGDASLMHVETERSIGATTLEVDIISNVPTTFIATSGKLLPSGFIDPATLTNFFGHLDGSNLEIDGFLAGTPDIGNDEGDVVIIKPNTFWAALVAQFIINMTNNGTPENVTVNDLVAAAITADSIATDGNIDVGGALAVAGNVGIVGTSRLVPAAVATVDGEGDIIPTKQVFSVTALDATAVIRRPTWLVQDRMVGELRILATGANRAISFSSDWKAIGVTAPSTAVNGKFLYIAYQYSESDDKFHILSVAREN